MPIESSPIQRYYERSLFRRCRFTLFVDRLELRGQRDISSDFEVTISLRDVSPHVSCIRQRHPWWIAGVMMQFVPFSMFFLLQAGRRSEHGFPWWLTGTLWLLGLGFGGVGLWLAFAGFPKREFIAFHHLNRLRLFDVGRVGPERQHFDGFVAAIKRQAASCQANVSGPAESPSSPA